ncbi:hypothetical protein [Modicisalibacter radicis]|uniref:hypothetical protein n=1 Tax=Halomonas sp. EAR18 TaxID=2518972 RepID=UPI001FCF1DE0|nr:hypothetical protein [Halomonas sp. EAR18]
MPKIKVATINESEDSIRTLVLMDLRYIDSLPPSRNCPVSQCTLYCFFSDAKSLIPLCKTAIIHYDFSPMEFRSLGKFKNFWRNRSGRLYGLYRPFIPFLYADIQSASLPRWYPLRSFPERCPDGGAGSALQRACQGFPPRHVAPTLAASCGYPHTI